jgi:integral membrane protein
MKSTKTFNWFRKIAFAEGVSFLVLLLIAMPLKYLASMPMAVTIVGGLHGLLFITFIVMAWEVKREYKKDWGWVVKSFIASIVPFGTFWMDHTQWKREEAVAQQTEL